MNLLAWLSDPIGVCDGLIVPLMTLRRAVEALDGERGKWWVEDPLVVHQVNHLDVPAVRMIQIFHARSGPDQGTDELGFMLPVLGDPSRANSALVCLAPEIIHFEMEGLYLEEGHVLPDFITDFERIWNPLREAVLRVR